MAQLSLAAVKKQYEGKQVLHGVDADIGDGQFVVIVGPSGCGKSTLLRMIAGLEDISAGTIAIDGVVMNDIEPADRGCAMVFQNYALYPHMTVRQNMAYPLKIAKMPLAERNRRVEETAVVLGLSDYLDRRPAQLSGGQRQRVAMGRAIVREPSVFLFDEPLSNLDAKLRVQMRIEIKRLHRKLKATSIFVTHDQVEAMTMADLLIVMNGGRIEQIGSPSAVYREPASIFVASFLGSPAMNLLPVQVENGQLLLESAMDRPLPVSAAALADGTRLTLGIRPEDIQLTNGRDGIPAVVDLVEELGGSRVCYCSAGNMEIAVVLPAGTDDIEGRRVNLKFAGEAIHLFDTHSGMRVPLLKAERQASHAEDLAVPA